MLLGSLLLWTTHHAISLLTGAVFIITGFSYISFKVAELIGDFKIYEFKHYYYKDDPIKDNDHYIILMFHYKYFNYYNFFSTWLIFRIAELKTTRFKKIMNVNIPIISCGI